MKTPIPSKTNPFDLPARHAQFMADFNAQLSKSRFWHVLPNGKTNPEAAESLLDTESGLRYVPKNTPADLSAFLKKHPFLYLRAQGNNTNLGTLHTSTGLLWFRDNSANGGQESVALNVNDGTRHVQQARWAGFSDWQLPTPEQLKAFAMANGNPHRAGSAYWLEYNDNRNPHHCWLTTQGWMDTREYYWSMSSGSGYIFACHAFKAWQVSDVERLLLLLKNGWQLVAPNNEAFSPEKPNAAWQNLKGEALWKQQLAAAVTLLALDGKATLNPTHYDITKQFSELDFTPCRLPKLEKLQLTDPNKGLWELWGKSAEELKRFGMVARNPERDVQRRAVAIDFGTSSTVVAVDTASGGRELLRIGANDFYKQIEAKHFENPTVLECVDFRAFEKIWTEQSYRPALNWNWMRASHEAQTSLRENTGDTAVLASILPRLKQWALRSSENNRVRLTDRKGLELELAPHAELNPVRGQALKVSADYPFDPIELYAWYLGMAINWRERGIFLKYYLSFPAKYPREVKDRILASFRRGLQRSLPHSLITQAPSVLNEIEVNDLASEPAAYAAAALPHLGVEPTEEGVPYAVFDFGGGTSDFDYGILRWATEDEEDQGYEQVFEHLASSGDNFLGGENLLEHLVYASFQQNLDVLRKNRIQFTKPLNISAFAGSEAFLANTQAAQTNSILLAAKLRPFLEAESKPEKLPDFKINLLNSNGGTVTCDLNINLDALDALLAQRIRAGVEAFLLELARIRPKLPQNTPIHLLLAGNGCRSRYIKALFDTQQAEWKSLLEKAFSKAAPEITVHLPLPMDDQNPHAPTAKTGVALGLLALVPGEGVLMCDHIQARHDGQAPFAWFVGRLRRGHFEPVLSPNSHYNQWHELGPLQQGAFNLYASQSPRAHQGLPKGDPELALHRQYFNHAPEGARLFVRATGPHDIELAAALTVEQLENHAVTVALKLA